MLRSIRTGAVLIGVSVIVVAVLALSAASSTHGPPTGVCVDAAAPPFRYDSVVVFAFENRTWNDVGLGFGQGMPYLHELGRQCAYFTDWTEARTDQNSLSQYVAQITGANQDATVDDCTPSATCSTQAESIFSQLRLGNRLAVNYVEGATKPCSASGNAAKHIPALYLWSADDRAACGVQVRPLREFNPERLPAFAFITPNLCNDGHDCDDRTVDRWAQAHVGPVLATRAYRAGRVAVFIWYDEDRPVPNLWLTKSAHAGPITLNGAGYAGTLRAWQSMLGLSCLGNGCQAPVMRVAANA